MLANPDQWADTMRWWAVVGALLGAWPLLRQLRLLTIRYRLGDRDAFPLPIERGLFGGYGLLCFLLFEIGAGFVIPLTNRIEGFTMEDATFRVFMAIMWTLGGLGSWLTAIGYNRNRWFMGAAATAWFVAVCFAATATAGG